MTPPPVIRYAMTGDGVRIVYHTLGNESGREPFDVLEDGA
jgi:hypothetical protein